MATTNAAGVSLIKSFEQCRLVAYQDEGGVWTLGWGATQHLDGSPIVEGDTWTQAQADLVFAHDLKTYETCVENAVSRDATPNEFAAMVSFAYNEGCGSFASSQILARFNAGDIAGAADDFGNWITVDGAVSAGLVRRRAAERALFLTP